MQMKNWLMRIGEFFKQKHIAVFNIMVSPGAGKTSVILKIIETLKDEVGIGVIEGDIASCIDAEKRLKKRASLWSK